MPIYEFVCSSCAEPFEELVRSASAVGEVVCPGCGSDHVNRKISMVAATISFGADFGPSAASAAACAPGGG